MLLFNRVKTKQKTTHYGGFYFYTLFCKESKKEIKTKEVRKKETIRWIKKSFFFHDLMVV